MWVVEGQSKCIAPQTPSPLSRWVFFTFFCFPRIYNSPKSSKKPHLGNPKNRTPPKPKITSVEPNAAAPVPLAINPRNQQISPICPHQTKRHHDAIPLKPPLAAMACDVVVQLDEHLCLTQDAPQLAAMFFRRPVTGIYAFNDGSQGVVTGGWVENPGGWVTIV